MINNIRYSQNSIIIWSEISHNENRTSNFHSLHLLGQQDLSNSMCLLFKKHVTGYTESYGTNRKELFITWPKMGCLYKAKEPSLPYYLLIEQEDIFGSMYLISK